MPHFPTPVLVGVDGTDRSRRAAEIALEIARATGSPLHLVHVRITQRPVTGVATGPAAAEGLEREARELLEREAAHLRGLGADDVALHPRLSPRVAEELGRLQEELGAGLLVVGRGGRSGVVAAVTSSPSIGTVRRAPGSVLVVR